MTTIGNARTTTPKSEAPRFTPPKGQECKPKHDRRSSTYLDHCFHFNKSACISF